MYMDWKACGIEHQESGVGNQPKSCRSLGLSSRASATERMREPALSEAEGERESRDLVLPNPSV